MEPLFNTQKMSRKEMGKISLVIHFSNMTYLDKQKAKLEISMPWEMEDEQFRKMWNYTDNLINQPVILIG